MKSIVRGARPTANFYILDKAISEDKRIGWAARGLLIFLLGKPDNWTVSIQNLINETKESSQALGRDGVYRVIKDLISAGYIQKVARRDEKGKIESVDYIVREQPLPDYPDTAEPDTANPTLLSTEVLTSTEDNQSLSSKPDASPSIAKGIVDYLNQKAGTKFQHTDSHIRNINARIKNGATEEELKQVIDRKCAEWLGDAKMNQYLRPATLFAAKKYDSYVGQLNQPLPKQKQGVKHSNFDKQDYSAGVDEHGYF